MPDIDRIEEAQDTDEVWSVSKLQTIQTCGRKYKYKYVDHIPESKTVQLLFGSLVHGKIDDIHKGKFESIGDLQESFVDSWRDNRNWDWSNELMTPTQYKNRGLKMLEQYWKTHRDDKVVESEVRFTVQAEGLKLRGIIDKIQEIEPGIYGVIDFKTSKNPPDPLVLRRDLQLTTYYLAAQKLGFKVNYLAIHHLLSGDVLWAWRDNDDIEDLSDAISDGIAKVQHKLFARNIDFQCKWCQYKEMCLSVDGRTS